MPDTGALWQRLCSGRRLWPWQWKDLAASATAERIRALAEASATLPSAGQQLAAGEALLRLLVEEGCRPLATNEETIQKLVDGLTPPDWPWNELDHQAEARQATEDALRLLAPESHAALRRLLTAPSPRLPANRIDWDRLRLAPKNAALRILEDVLGEGDLPLLESLWRDGHEPSGVRDHAVKLYLRHCGPRRAVETVPFLTGAYGGSGDLRYAVPRDTRAALVEPLVTVMCGNGSSSQWRAYRLLMDCGQEAIGPLTRVIREHPDEFVRRFAQLALHRVDPSALAAALAANAEDEVGLSPAASPEADAERGLSTPEG